MVSRPRLTKRLKHGVTRKLTLISAPAGFGKTTLLAEWLADRSSRSQTPLWVSLDANDNDPKLYWAYIITALQAVSPRIGNQILPLLYDAQPPPLSFILTSLINEMGSIDQDVTLILDDYHLIENDEIHEGMVFLLDRLPWAIHLVLTSRNELPFPTARLRGRGELTEVYAQDLQFSPDEAEAFLNQHMGLGLHARDVTTLRTQTEGWIAGLKLAALSMQKRNDVAGFVKSFAGNNRYVTDFLIEEVLRHQPEHIRRFLLHTSVLNQLCGSLCDALTGYSSSHQLLATLEKRNLFVIPLDDKRHWYRYHHLFRDTLQSLLVQEYPEHISVLHQQASAWYEANGWYSAAIQHALDAEDIGRAADLVERVADEVYESGQSETLYGWLHALPDHVFHNRPVISFLKGWALLDRGRLEASKKYLRVAEQYLDGAMERAEVRETPLTDRVVIDEKQFQALPGRLAVAKAMAAQAHGDVSSTMQHAQYALNCLPPDDHLWRGGAMAIFGLASWASGDLALAYQSIADGMASVRKMGGVHFQLMCMNLMGDIRVVQGRLRAALRIYERALRLVSKQNGPVVRATGDIYLGMSEILLEQGDLEAAVHHLNEGKKLGEHAALVEYRDRWCAAEARIQEIRGDLDGALALLDEAEHLYMRDPAPRLWPHAARKARIWMVQGRISEALAWAQTRGLSVDDEPQYMLEFEHLTLARLLLAQYHVAREPHYLHQAKQLLTRLQHAAEAGERGGSLIEIFILLAIVHWLEHRTSSSFSALERSLRLAEPQNYVQVFHDGGKDFRDLLRQAVAEGIGGAYARQLVAHLSEAEQAIERANRGGDVLAEPLTNREIEILRLIASGLRNREVADQLYISVSTVKRHISNVYGKMEVSHRTEAVARAKALGLLG